MLCLVFIMLNADNIFFLTRKPLHTFQQKLSLVYGGHYSFIWIKHIVVQIIASYFAQTYFESCTEKLVGTPCTYTLYIHPVHTPCTYTPYIHPVRTPRTYVHPVRTPYYKPYVHRTSCILITSDMPTYTLVRTSDMLMSAPQRHHYPF